LTHSQKHPLEQQLISELQRAEALYRRMLTGLNTSLPKGDCGADEITAGLTRVQPLMLQIQTMESTLAPLRKEWTRQSQPAGPILKQILHQHEEILKTLIHRIDVLEQQLQQHRQAALPEMDRFVRHQQMQRAYQQAVR